MIGPSQVLKAGQVCSNSTDMQHSTPAACESIFRYFFPDPITSQDLSLILKLGISDIVLVDEGM